MRIYCFLFSNLFSGRELRNFANCKPSPSLKPGAGLNDQSSSLFEIVQKCVKSEWHCLVSLFYLTYHIRETVFHGDMKTRGRGLKIRCATEYFGSSSAQKPVTRTSDVKQRSQHNKPRGKPVFLTKLEVFK